MWRVSSAHPQEAKVQVPQRLSSSTQPPVYKKRGKWGLSRGSICVPKIQAFILRMTVEEKVGRIPLMDNKF